MFSPHLCTNRLCCGEAHCSKNKPNYSCFHLHGVLVQCYVICAFIYTCSLMCTLKLNTSCTLRLNVHMLLMLLFYFTLHTASRLLRSTMIMKCSDAWNVASTVSSIVEQSACLLILSMLSATLDSELYHCYAFLSPRKKCKAWFTTCITPCAGNET